MKLQIIFLAFGMGFFFPASAGTGLLLEAKVNSVTEKEIKVATQSHEISLLKKELPKDIALKLTRLVGQTQRMRFIAPTRSIASMNPVKSVQYDPQDVNNRDR